jgi:L-ascorbate metabolism protein UlaG (beta-lactamase superfamily)
MWRRRAWLAGAGTAGLAGFGAMLYNASPRAWREMARDSDRPVAPPPRRPKPRDWPEKGLQAAWLGHSTVLVRVDGFTFITDPIFSEKAGIHVGPWSVGVKRLVAPAAAPDELPRVDLVLLSHAHMDHFDIPSVRKLESKRTTVVTASLTGDLLRTKRYKAVHELAWGERVRLGPVECRALEVRHWGARLRTDTYRGYNGYLVETPRYRVLFAGDTAVTDTFRSLKTLRGVDLAIMPIGTYNPWLRNHCNPEQAWQMGNDAGSQYFIPIHHQTFQLSREPLSEPLERFQAAAGSHPERILLTEIGQETRLS